VFPDGSADSPARKARAARPRLVVSNPDAGNNLGRVADEPGIPVIVGCAGLARGRPFQSKTFQTFGCAVSEHVFQHLRRHKSGGGRKHGGVSQRRFLQGLTPAIIGADYGPGMRMQAAVGQRRVGRDQIMQGDFFGAKGKRKVIRLTQRQSQPVGEVNKVRHTYRIEELDGNNVVGVGQSLPEAQLPVAFFFVVVGSPLFIASLVVDDRVVIENIARRISVFQGRRINQGFDR